MFDVPNTHDGAEIEIPAAVGDVYRTKPAFMLRTKFSRASVAAERAIWAQPTTVVRTFFLRENEGTVHT